MTREELQKLGLTDEQVDSVMKLHGTDVQAGQKAQQELESVIAERDGLKEQITQRDKDIKSLKKNAGDSETLTTKLDELQKQYDTDTQNLNNQLASTKKNAALVTGLSGTGARDVQDLLKFIDQERVQLDDDGVVTGLEEQVKSLRESKPYLFSGTPTAHYQPQGGNGKGGVDIAAAINNEKVNLTDVLKDKGE